MSVIQQTIDVSADPDAVYDLIASVESFPNIFRQIKSVMPSGHDTFLWKAVLAGKQLTWEGRVTRQTRPWYFSWESVTGVSNAGSYTINQIPGGSRLCFFMEYHLPAGMISVLLTPLVDRLIRNSIEEAMGCIKTSLGAKATVEI